MTDERYVFTQDVREKKNIARSSHNKRTHCGKGGGVKMPSDYLSTKERKALSGAVKTYRMNEPMEWSEFKQMPADLQKTYIEALREKYGAPTHALGEMFGVHYQTVLRTCKFLGISGQHGRLDEPGWNRFLNREAEPLPEVEDKPKVNGEAREGGLGRSAETMAPPDMEKNPVICSGNVTFVGDAASVFTTMMPLIGGKKLKITITWEGAE